MRALFLSIFVLTGVVLAQDPAATEIAALKTRLAELEKANAELERKLETAKLDAAAKGVENAELKKKLGAATVAPTATPAPTTSPPVTFVLKGADGIAGVFTLDPATGNVKAALANEGDRRQEVMFSLRQTKPDGTTETIVAMRPFTVATGGVDGMSVHELTAPKAVELTVLTGRAAALYEREQKREQRRSR